MININTDTYRTEGYASTLLTLVLTAHRRRKCELSTRALYVVEDHLSTSTRAQHATDESPSVRCAEPLQVAKCGAAMMPSLPKERTIDRSKLVDYLLHPDKGRGKAAIFNRYGFELSNWQALERALLVHAQAWPVSAAVASDFGTKYIVTGSLATPSGRQPEPLITAVWHQDTGHLGVRLITAYPG